MTTRWIAATAALGLLLGAGSARADGVAMLDGLEGGRDALTDAAADAAARVAEIDGLVAGGPDAATLKALKKERSALQKALKAGAKAAPYLDESVAALRGNDIPAFAAAARRGLAGLAKAEKAFGATYLAGGTTAGIADVFGVTLAEARTVIDATASAAAKKAGQADGAGLKGAALLESGRPDKAAASYLKGMDLLHDLPMPVAGHGAVLLRSLDDRPLNIALGVAPYSPKRTCGACHDYALITEGYHFDQGRMAVRDDYASGLPIPQYILSDGMYGRW
jgi:hypothetical protein